MDFEQVLIMLVIGIVAIYVVPSIISRNLYSKQVRLLEEEGRLDERNRNLNLDILKAIAEEPEYEVISIDICKKCGFVNQNTNNACTNCESSLSAKGV